GGPAEAACLARACGIVGKRRAAASLQPSPAVSAVCRAGSGDRRRERGGVGGADAARLRAAAVAAAARDGGGRAAADRGRRLAFLARAVAWRRGRRIAPAWAERR